MNIRRGKQISTMVHTCLTGIRKVKCIGKEAKAFFLKECPADWTLLNSLLVVGLSAITSRRETLSNGRTILPLDPHQLELRILPPRREDLGGLMVDKTEPRVTGIDCAVMPF